MLELTSSNTLLNAGCPSSPCHWTWMNGCYVCLMFLQTRLTASLGRGGHWWVLEESWKAGRVERSFFNSHTYCLFRAAVWWNMVFWEGCCESLEEKVWCSPGSIWRGSIVERLVPGAGWVGPFGLPEVLICTSSFLGLHTDTRLFCNAPEAIAKFSSGYI